MSDGEIDRRIAERDAADRRYNDALTRVDQALPQLSAPRQADVAIDVDAGSLRDRAAILTAAPQDPPGWRGRVARFVRRLVDPVFARQQEFNGAVAAHLEQASHALRRVASALPDTRAAGREELQAFVAFNSILVQYLQHITPFIDTKVRVLEASLEELRMAAASAQRAAIAARREVDRAAQNPAPSEAREEKRANDRLRGAGPPAGRCGALGAGYVGFEDLFRGTTAEIRARQADYADRFAGSSDVLDVGCGRGEFLELLRDRGVPGIGIDMNQEMVDVCRARGLRAYHADALGYLAGVPDDSLGGLTALQVVEHLEPDYLVRLLETAFAKMRPGATILLETINAACWVAYFESYIRDITHVRPLHPETLKFLVVAAGFERVDVHFRSPVAESGRLERAGADDLPPSVADIVRTMNANVERLNERMFTYLDYAVIGVKSALNTAAHGSAGL